MALVGRHAIVTHAKIIGSCALANNLREIGAVGAELSLRSRAGLQTRSPLREERTHLKPRLELSAYRLPLLFWLRARYRTAVHSAGQRKKPE